MSDMIKALTICQPYAHLICLPDDDDRAKRVENRTWPANYRGPLLIHAGKSREWLSGDNYEIDVAEMRFGAIIGIANLADCVQKGGLTGNPSGFSDAALRRWPWLAAHQHAEGPWCFVLTECRRFDVPIPYRGAQGLFDVPKDVLTLPSPAKGK